MSSGMLFGPLVTPYLKQLGFSAALVGTLVALQSGVSSVSSVAGGFLGDLIGRRRTLMLARALSLVYMGIFLFNRSYLGFVIAFSFNGLTSLFYAPYSAVQADACDDSNRGTMLGIVNTASWAMQMAVPLAAGLLADRFSPRVSFVVSLPLAICALGSLSFLRTPAIKAHASGSGSSFVKRFHDIWRPGWRKSVAFIALLEFTNGIHNGVLNISIPFFMMERFGAGFAAVSGVGVMVALGSLLTGGIAGHLSDRRGRRPVSILSFASSAALFFCFPLMTRAWHVYLVFFLLGFLGNAAMPAIMSLEMESVGENARSTFSGVLMGANTLGSMIGASVGGLLYSSGPVLAFTMAMVCGVAETLCLVVGIAETRPQSKATGVTAKNLEVG
jgi:MFS family permease